MTRILVTGGTGLLGSYLLRLFLRRGYTHITSTFQNPNAVIPADLKDKVEWKRLRLPDIPDAFDVVEGHDWVIHSAGLISYYKEDKYKLLDVNKTGTEHIVNACLDHGVKHLVYIGSIGALGKESKKVTLNETHPWLQTKYSTSYGLSKYLGELEVWRGAAEGLNASVVLPSIILGSGDWKRSSLQLIDRIVNKAPFIPAGLTGYVDVRDVCLFILNLLEKSMSGDRWILSSENLTYQEIYDAFAKELAVKRTFRQSPKWIARIGLLMSNLRSGRMSYPEIVDQIYASFTYDTSKSRSVEGFSYRPMEESIRDVARVYREGNISEGLKF